MTNFTQHKRTYLFYFFASVIIVIASVLLKYKAVSVQIDRMLQVVAVVAAVYGYFQYKRFNKSIQELRNYPDPGERFQHFSAAYKKYWFQLFVIIAVVSFGYFLTANTAFLILTIAELVSLIIFLPSRFGIEKLIKIPHDHPVMK